MHIFHYAPHERVQAAVALGRVRDSRGGGRRSPARRRARRPLRRRATRPAGWRGELLAQEARAPPRLRALGDDASARAAVRSSPTRPGWRPATAELLEAIRAYNEEDCRSTLSLRDWLLDEMRPEAEAEFGRRLRRTTASRSRARSAGRRTGCPTYVALVDRLKAGLPAHPGRDDDRAQAERACSHICCSITAARASRVVALLRSARKAAVDLIDDRDAVAGLVRDDDRPRPSVSSARWTTAFTFPAQEFRLDVGDADDPTTGERFNVVACRRRPRDVCVEAAPSHPGARRSRARRLPINVRGPRERRSWSSPSLCSAATNGSQPRARILRREPPRTGFGRPRRGHRMRWSPRRLGSIIGPAVQGPPGTGKTFRGARMIVAALAAGRRVGITASSHAAIQNLLADVESAPTSRAASSRASTKGDGYESPHGLVDERLTTNDNVTDDHQLVAGTAWLFARAEHREKFDSLFIDEAGQFALANAAAVGLPPRTSSCSATRSSYLRSPRPSTQTARAPRCSSTSSTAQARSPPGDGVLLTETWRMHPAVCAFVSERSYDSRLESRGGVRNASITALVGAIAAPAFAPWPIRHTRAGARQVRKRPGDSRGLSRAARRRHCHRRCRDNTRPRFRGHSGCRAVQPRRANYPRLRPGWGACWDCGPLPRTAGARRLLRNDLLGRRGRSPWPRIPLRCASLQRRDLARPVHRRGHVWPAAIGC